MMALLISTALTVSAQEPTEDKRADNIEVDIFADLLSQYVWRGMPLGSACLQPSLGLSWKGLSLSATGNRGLTTTDDPEEIDLTAAFTTGGLTVGIIDYWNNSPEPRYLIYDAHSTSHVFEAFASYDFGPLAAAWYTNFTGNDGVNKNGKRAYSSYAELNAPFQLAQCEWTATVGVVPYATSFYETNGFSVTNLSVAATKSISITDHFALPVFAQLTANPSTESMYFVFGLRLQP